MPRHDPRLNLTAEELWEEWRAWEIFQTPPEPPETAESAWQQALVDGRYRPDDHAARTAFIAAWMADHAAASEDPALVDDWEPLREEEGRHGP